MVPKAYGFNILITTSSNKYFAKVYCTSREYAHLEVIKNVYEEISMNA